jgi:hypothetical protein
VTPFVQTTRADSARRARHGVVAAAAGALALASGCAAPPLAPIDLAEPGWTVRVSAAVWHPPGNAPELAGELLVASHPDGRL